MMLVLQFFYSAKTPEVVAELQSRGDTTDISTFIQVDGETIEGAIDYNDRMSLSSTAEPESSGGDDDLVFIMYTSGTTGLPKGVMHSHNTVLWANITIQPLQICSTLTGSQMLPLFHVGALTPVITSVSLADQ